MLTEGAACILEIQLVIVPIKKSAIYFSSDTKLLYLKSNSIQTYL